MPSQLVDDVRALIRARQEAGCPVTDLERTFILAALGQRVRAGSDVVDELEDAIVEARRILLGTPPAILERDVVDQARRTAAKRLIAAARGALDYDPFVEYDPTAAAPPDRARPERADIDG